MELVYHGPVAAGALGAGVLARGEMCGSGLCHFRIRIIIPRQELLVMEG